MDLSAKASLHPSSTDIWPWKEGEEVAIAKLQRRVKGAVPDCVLQDLPTLRRFLIARQYDEDAAAALLKKATKWREEYHPDRIKKADIAEELKQGKIFLHGVDNQKRPCLVLMPGRHQPHRDKDRLATSLRALIYWIEKAIRSMPDGVYQYVIIVDRTGFSLRNIDWNLMKEFAALQDLYPERLAGCYIIRANFLVRRLWEALKTFAEPHTIAKFRILGDDFQHALLGSFPRDQLLPAHGGTSRYVYAPDELRDSHDSPVTPRRAALTDDDTPHREINTALVRDLESSVRSWDPHLTESLKHILLSDKDADEPPLPTLPQDGPCAAPLPSPRTRPADLPAESPRSRIQTAYSY
eukprot:TRINITY_DN31090_c0_g1_i1.p1 TRINITY_DN31090_c0_g1~~TRINITY_DN31090_c0_g1_i1.p1  ORF type:complete len:353 (+),score=106.18 TRINITY_DN31090_c0_g1_i1:97-1155(+)